MSAGGGDKGDIVFPRWVAVLLAAVLSGGGVTAVDRLTAKDSPQSVSQQYLEREVDKLNNKLDEIMKQHAMMVDRLARIEEQQKRRR